MKRAEWIKRMAEDFKKKEENYPQLCGAVVVGKRVAVMDLSTASIGVATCSQTDNFDLDTGLAIAYARLVGRDIPRCVICGVDGVRISELKNGQRFRYKDSTFIFCGEDETRRHRFERDTRRHESKYMAYDEKKHTLVSFYDDDGAEVID